MATANREHFPHDPDISVRVIGNIKAQAFEHVARALTAVITDPDSVGVRKWIRITCEEEDDGLLLTDWRNALVTKWAPGV